jgi:hypothetical protein
MSVVGQPFLIWLTRRLIVHQGESPAESGKTPMVRDADWS